MSDKKQIEEMAKLACTVFDGNCSNCPFNFYPPCPPKASAERLFNAGYRKQIEGEWIVKGEPRMTDIGKQIPVECSSCSIQRRIPTVKKHGYYFCPNCGAKMKGE